MIKLFEFHFLDIYNEEYVISIYDSESDVQGEIKTAKLYGQDGFILNYEKENIDIVQGGIIKSDVTFSVVNEGGILDNFLKNLQSYENRYLVEIMYNENIFWRGIMLNDYITFDDSKIQVIKFNCTDGLGLLQNIDYTDDISKLDSTTMQFDSDAYGNGLIDVISRALSFNPVTKFFEGSYNYIYYKSDYISDDMLNDWDALVYTNILKHKENTTLLTTPFADYTLKDTLSGKKIKIYEYKSCYDVINECLKVFNLCLCQRGGVWQIFNIRDFENNKDNYIYHVADYNKYNYYKNIKNKTAGASVSNAKCAIGGTSDNKRGSGEFGLNSVVKKIEQRYVPYYVKEGTFNNLIYSGNHGGDLQWYSYPAGVVTGVSGGNLVFESNFNDWNLCSKYHYHNELDIFTAMTKLQFLINFAIKYTLSAGSGYVHTSMIKPKMDLNLNVNGKWLDSNGNWVDNLPIGNWWHKFTGVFEGYDRVINVNFSKYFDLQIPNQGTGKLVVDFYFRIYTQTNVIGTLPWNFKITNIDNNSVLKLVDNNGNDIESIDYKVENDTGILDLEIEQAFIDNFGESEENNILFTAVQDLGLDSYRYKKSKKWKNTDESTFYNLIELRLREIAAMNNHPLLNWQGIIYYDKDTNVNYMLFYLIKYNLTLQNYVMFPQRWTFYARKKYAEADLIEVSKDFVRVISSNDLAITDFNLPMVPTNSGTGTIVTADEGLAIVPANRINLAANDTVNEIINVSRQNGETDFIVEYDEENQEINWKNNTETLLKITNDGISYKNEKTAGSGIEIDSSNKINVKIDNDTIKLNTNNELYANVTGFDINEFLQKSFITYLEKNNFYVNLNNIESYNLLTALSTSLESYFMRYYNDKININLSQINDYTQLKAYIENNIILDLEHKDSIFITYQDKIYIFNYDNNQFELIYENPEHFYITDISVCNVDTIFNDFPTLYFIANGTLWNLESGDTSIECTKFIIYNHDIFVFYDGKIIRFDKEGNYSAEATSVNVDGFFAAEGTIFYWDTVGDKTYIRQNGVWNAYTYNAIKKLLFYSTVFIRILSNDIDGCVLKNKLFIFKSDGIYLHIWGNIYLLDYNISNITHVSCTEDFAYIYAKKILYKFDGDILTEIGSYDISEILAVSTKDTKFSIAESGINDNLQFGNNSQSMLLKKYHNDSYAINLSQNNNFYTSLFVKNLVVKSEIKNIKEKTLKEKVEDYANTIKTWTDIDLWLRADWGIVTDVNNKVSRWEDFVHPDYNIIQNVADRRPLLVDNYANTFPALQFDGVDDYLNGGDICDLKLSGCTLITVLQHEYLTYINHFAISKANNYNADKSWYIRIIHGSGRYRIGFAVVKGSEIIYSAGGNYQTSAYKLENVVTAWKIDNANNVIKKYQNGVNTDTDAFDGTYDMNNNYDLIIGAVGRTGLDPQLFWKGHIMEILKFNRVLTDDEFAYVHEYLNLKYNLY